jgi:hypothetical protein
MPKKTVKKKPAKKKPAKRKPRGGGPNHNPSPKGPCGPKKLRP